MFGHNPLNYGNIHTLLHNAETRIFKATDYDIEPDAGYSGKYTTFKWNGSNYIPTFNDGSTGNAGNMNATQSANWVRTVLSKTKGHGVKFESLSPDDEGTSGNGNGNGGGNGDPADCASENREDGATDDVCGDCLSGFTEDDTGTCVADAEDEEEESNFTRNFAIGAVIVCVIGIASQFR